MKKEAGYVYILTNPSFKEDWVKIGKSSRPVDVRSKELDNTAVPMPFEIYATLKTSKYEEVEKLIHKTIDRLTDLRIRQNREFFNVPPAKALDILRDISTTLDDAEIDEVHLKNKKAETEEPPRTGRNELVSKFSMVHIPIGATLVFVPTGTEVKVAGRRPYRIRGTPLQTLALCGDLYARRAPQYFGGISRRKVFHL